MTNMLTSSLSEFFRDSVEGAMRNQGLETTQETEFYLVNLLETFTKAEQLHGPPGEDGRDEPLALTLHRALSTPPGASFPLYRQIGDRSLYVSGFFSRSLERRAVSRNYYHDMGRSAYETLSAMMAGHRDRVFAAIFAELADKFARLVEVLIEISERHAFSAPSDAADLLDRWADAGSARAAAQLVRDGYLPLWRFEAERDQGPGGITLIGAPDDDDDPDPEGAAD